MIHELGEAEGKTQLLPHLDQTDDFIASHWISHASNALQHVGSPALDAAGVRYQSFSVNSSSCLPPARWGVGMPIQNLCIPDYTAFYMSDEITEQVRCLFQDDLRTYGYSHDPQWLHEPGRLTLHEYIDSLHR